MKKIKPKYPVYIVSKGRWEKRRTVRCLDKFKMPYKIVVEPQEFDKYSEVIDSDKIITLPFKNLGKGSIPARNFIWKHAAESGSKKHWILDDNIHWFYRFNRNLKAPVSSGTIFRIAEIFIDRYENIAISGFNYFKFVKNKYYKTPYKLNTRVYSCMLIDNSLPIRWRGKYNEDTDLCLRVLKLGYVTLLFNAFICDKQNSMKDKGGNTESLYQIKDGRLKMAESLVQQHPEISTITKKFNRYQHQVNYNVFKKNKLNRKNIFIPDKVINYGLKLIEYEK